jgi:hypothetical protein
MARITHVKKAQQRYKMVPVLNEDGFPKSTPVLRQDGTPKLTRHGSPIFRAVTVADKDQPLPPLVCDHCHQPIEVGTPYKWVAVKRTYGGVTYNRHEGCPNWRQSQLSTSRMAEIYDAQEDASTAIFSAETNDDLEAARDAFAEVVREVAEGYRESADNIEDGFGHPTGQSEELAGRADELESWADEIEDWSADDNEPDEDDDGWTDDDGENPFQEAHDEWLSAAQESLDSLIGECPL